MKIINDGTEKEVDILKHFKINEDEYIIYKDVDEISMGLINQNKIVSPNSDNFDVLKKILGNLISDNPDNSINIDNNCTILNNNIETLEKESSQKVQFSENQISNLIKSFTSTEETNEKLEEELDKPVEKLEVEEELDKPVEKLEVEEELNEPVEELKIEEKDLIEESNMNDEKNNSINKKEKKRSKKLPIILLILLLIAVGVVGFVFRNQIFGTNESDVDNPNEVTENIDNQPVVDNTPVIDNSTNTVDQNTVVNDGSVVESEPVTDNSNVVDTTNNQNAVNDTTNIDNQATVDNTISNETQNTTNPATN